MNHIPVQPAQQVRIDSASDPSMQIVGRVGIALFIFGIFVPGTHTLQMVGLSLIAISYLL
jgi:hypothetical protein